MACALPFVPQLEELIAEGVSALQRHRGPPHSEVHGREFDRGREPVASNASLFRKVNQHMLCYADNARVGPMRTMIVLPDHHHAEAKRKAASEGISLSEYIRGLVAHDLEQGESKRDPSIIFGLFDSGGSRIADQKQAMISEAIDKRFAAKGL